MDAVGSPLLLLQDYIFTEGDLVFQPGETRKEVQVPLLELTEIDTLLHNFQLKQFAIDLLHPKYGAKIGRYPQTTVTIADPGRGWQPGGGEWRQGMWDPHTGPGHPEMVYRAPALLLTQKAAMRRFLQLRLVDSGLPLEALVGIDSGWEEDG